MRPFTDKDLMQLKHAVDSLTYVSKNSPRLKGFIARLEAAEECLKDYFEVGSVHPKCLAEWRKVAGK